MKWSILVGLVVCLAKFCDGLAIKCLPGSTDPSCTKERKGYSIPERNQSLSEATEVQCLAGSEWDSNCHHCRCSYQGRAECLKQSNDCDKGEVLAKPALCKTNTTFENDCNACTCENGLALCTMMSCRRSAIKCQLGSTDPSCTKERKRFVPNRNQSLSEATEVQCLAGSEWDSNCHHCRCSYQGLAECLKQSNDCDKGEVLAKPALCKTNTTFENDCNTCTCENGLALCTMMFCRRSGILASATHLRLTSVNSELDDKDAQKSTKIDVAAPNFTLSRKVRAFTTEPPKACQPGQEFRLDCNKCLCDNKGQDFSCTRIDCNALNNNHHASAFTGARSKRDTSEQVSMQCVPGSVFDRDCNVCRCTESGQFATCTIKRCKENTTETAPESDQGFRCNPGEQFRRDCNDCTCSADGRSVFCTLRLCDQALTSDI